MTPALAAYLGLTALLSPALLARSQRDVPSERHRERAGIPTIAAKPGVTWVSAASVGELRAILPLLPDLGPTLVTTQTPTAAELAKEHGLTHQYTPVDTPAAVIAFLRNWKPRAAIFVESELPQRMVRSLAKRGVPMALVAARRSKTRERFPRTIAETLTQFRILTASTSTVADELTALGLTVAATEDLKASGLGDPVPAAVLEPWAAVAARPIWLAASTHPGDEDVVLRAHQSLLEQEPEALLFLAPRHPDRFEEVASQIKVPFTRQSRAERPTVKTMVHLIDVMGALPVFHTLAPVTFLGGSFDQLGGHSPYEAARYASHVLTGPDVSHHTAAFEHVAHEMVTPDSLVDVILNKWKQDRPTAFVPKPGTKTRDAVLEMLDSMPR